MLDSTKVRIAGIAHESVVDGPGLRSTVFFQGCPHGCFGCHNPETWDRAAGYELSGSQLFEQLKINPLLSGITFSGGEPFLQAAAAAEVGRKIKQTGLNLWVYTGYTWEYLMNHLQREGFKDLLAVTDILVDGPFISRFKSSLQFRGSNNQRMIRVSESLTAGAVIPWVGPDLVKISS